VRFTSLRSNRLDQHHVEAVAVAQQLRDNVLTTEWVLAALADTGWLEPVAKAFLAPLCRKLCRKLCRASKVSRLFSTKFPTKFQNRDFRNRL